MIDAEVLLKEFSKLGSGLITGVPDSLLSKLSACAEVKKFIPHIITANEGNAIGLALGEYLVSQNPAVVYMQNSGLGNTVNPLASLMDEDVYSIPVFLVIGWRGEPGVKDEPQHVKQGKITLGQLELLGIPYRIIGQEDSENTVLENVKTLWSLMLDKSKPVALVVRKGAITGNWKLEPDQFCAHFKREHAIETVLKQIPRNSFVVATTGKTGRELYELREQRGEPHHDFLTVGGMGHASSIAYGVARKTKKTVVCLDGDGAALMHLGALGIIGNSGIKNFLHLIFNNRAHESVGGQPTVAGNINFELISKALGYEKFAKVEDEAELISAIEDFKSSPSLTLIEVVLQQGSRENLGRPKSSPVENKLEVISFLNDGN